MKIRPTLEIISPHSPEDIKRKLKVLEEQPARCDASVLRSYAQIRIPEKEMHYWSPQLNIEWSRATDGTTIKGRFGPRPSVWTLFAGFYLFSIFLGVMGGIFGLAQRQLDLPPWALWSVPAAAILLALSYSIAASGQKLGHEQMDELERLLKETIEQA